MSHIRDLLARSPGSRVLFSVILGLVLAWAMSEIAYLRLKDTSDHEPQRFELTIPPGTAARVAAGEAVPSIPVGLVFVVDDVLVVQNEDITDHQLGPVWVPPGATASLRLAQANKFDYACTFQPTRYLGLDVRPRVTMWTRLQAVLMAGLPLGALMTLYGLVLFPLRSKRNFQPE